MLEYFKELLNPVSILGFIASGLVLVSMCFNTKTVKGEHLMRVVNLIASILSSIYGALLGPSGLSLVVLNVSLTIVNLYHLLKPRS